MTSMSIRFMLTFLIMVTLAGCDDKKPATDAAPDVAVVPLDCPSYCTAILKKCTGSNTQYSGTTHCMAACALFTLGTSTVKGDNTIGCRIYYASTPLIVDLATDC